MNNNDGGMAVVRLKPLGVDGGGWRSERNAFDKGSASMQGKQFKYLAHVITPVQSNANVYELFMPRRIEAFVGGVNVNVMAYGQTGTGKTHPCLGRLQG